MRDEQEAGRRSTGIGAIVGWRARSPAARPPAVTPQAEADGPRARPSRPRRSRASTTRPAASNAVADLRLAVDEDPRRDEHAARPQLVAQGAGASGTSTPAMRFASTTSNGGSPVGQAAVAAPGSRRTSRFRRALASVASTAIGSVSTPSADAAPSRTAAIARIPEPHPTSRTRAPASAPRSASGLGRREAEPRRRVEAGPERHPRVEREDDVVRAPHDAGATSAG